MLLEADDLRDLFDELDAEPGVVIGAESETVVSEAKPQPDRGVPAVICGDQCVVDVTDRCRNPDPAVGRD